MRKILSIVLLCLSASLVQAQVVIGGKVFGGARQADVKGHTFVNIGADSANVLINSVYGGNDIAGTIGTSKSLPVGLKDTLENGIDTTYNAFVRTSRESEGKHLFIGNLFGGGNGDYNYSLPAYKNMQRPELGKTYLEITGGTIAYVYGGGNNATVTSATNIYVNDSSIVTTEILDANNKNLLLDSGRLESMGIAILGDVILRPTYHFSRIFGGNNKADMSIHPTWNLRKGNIENLYSGGNEGRMTHKEGLLLEIADTSEVMVNNVYGGCRKADVRPLEQLTDTIVDVANDKIQLHDASDNQIYNFPAGLSARVLVRGGDINNVYGGNDVSGRVYGGNAVGVYTSIRGDVYGGGNGSYAYTDNESLKNTLHYGDYYYDKGDTTAVAALNSFRPNAEQVSVRLKGKDQDHPTIIGGSVYVGGNSATLSTTKANPMVELKIGSHVIAENVFLGNNGANMVKSDTKTDVLRVLASKVWNGQDSVQYSSMTLTDSATFAQYMEGAALNLMPSVVFDSKEERNDPDTYEEYSSYFGSIFCGGNVGSMNKEDSTVIDFTHKIIIYNKVVGGCNNANVEGTNYNAAYYGGLLGSASKKTGNKLILNFNGLKIQPKRWKLNPDNTQYKNALGYPELEWNTIYASTGENTPPITTGGGEDYTSDDNDLDRRLKGGNIYGGCYNTGHVNGNVVINLNASIIDRDSIFDRVKEDEENGEAKLNEYSSYTILKRQSGVLLDEQGMDVLGVALNVFGGGYGAGSEIWGSTTINLNKGYTFQIFGGGENGAIGKKDADGKYSYDPKYSAYINLGKESTIAGVRRGDNNDNPDIAECEFIYGGGFMGPIAGNTVVNLGNGRIFDSFAGSCNADIYGHTETYVGRDGFPYIRDNIYGGNDLGGSILGEGNFKSRVRPEILSKVYKYKPATKNEDGTVKTPDGADVLNASAYVEYIKGRVDTIFGGCYGYYDYSDPIYNNFTYTAVKDEDGHVTSYSSGATASNLGQARSGFTKPRLHNAFVNLRPANGNYSNNKVSKVYGAGQGYPGEMGKDSMQVRSYVLVDAPLNVSTFQNTEIFGSGAYGGIGMGIDPIRAEQNPDSVSAVIDLMCGKVKNVYGASYKEGFTRRTVVNVPKGSTIRANNIFGGGFGVTNEAPCDAYEATVNFHSDSAYVSGAIYGGNNNCRRTLYGTVNVSVPVWKDSERKQLANIYGAGFGENTWSQYTEVNLTDSARVDSIYGGGKNGRVLNKQSVAKWDAKLRTQGDSLYMVLGAGYIDNGLAGSQARYKYNTNVRIHPGAVVEKYAYGGGLGADTIPSSGNVCGTTHIELLGGTVMKDIYGGGTVGAVLDEYEDKTFIASTNVNIQGGTVRNVYGGGWLGIVGHTEMTKTPVGDIYTATIDKDIAAQTHVTVGLRGDLPDVVSDYGFYNGIPAIQRSVYGGGERGAVYGSTHLTINNGYIGYNYGGKATKTISVDEDRDSVITYEVYNENLDDKVAKDHELDSNGNAFGGGYDEGGNVDSTNVTMWGGQIRGCLFGGGEIAAVGRGETMENGVKRTLKGFYKAGKTNIRMYNGLVMRHVFGGGRGYNTWNTQNGNLYTDGYVFGQTDVRIYGGEIGTDEGLDDGYGNVFGGGDIGYIYSKGFFSDKTLDEKDRYKTGHTGSPNHWYYYDDDGNLTEDCKVVISPRLQAKTDTTINGNKYMRGEYVKTEDLNILPKKDSLGIWSGWENLDTGTDDNERGVTIHNAVFAGGNVSSNSDKTYANATTVFGNATATLFDVYHRDFITVGTEHTGGLYGGGNLSVADGYRELNITNYGTDYYGLDARITLQEYRALSNRERAYFQLEYICKDSTETKTVDGAVVTGKTIDGEFYQTGQHLTEEKYLKMLERHKDDPQSVAQYWEPFGFCSIYAGRLLNTIQRADLCGVYGSRMVLQGAKDRVAEVGENIDYTINRVGELSLNQQRSIIPTDTGNDALHGNYFGIYSLVNYMGNLTSDVHFGDNYIDKDGKTAKDSTFYSYKKANKSNSQRNYGQSYNQVALASGVFLELTTENSTATHKDYGYVTGIVELDLINVKQDQVGGGFVYAKNEHRVPKYYPTKKNVILSEYNHIDSINGVELRDEACTFKRYRYDNSNSEEWPTDKVEVIDPEYSSFETVTYQTSGNFIHPKKRIVDDCYPINNAYTLGQDPYSEAHYWYVKGDVYIYDQKVSAYTGSATAYSKQVHLPLTITAASHGKLELINVKPNLYAYYTLDDAGNTIKIGEKDSNGKKYDKVTVNNESESYKLNDVITWWDWNRLTYSEQRLFVNETYVNCVTCTVDTTEYAPGECVMDSLSFANFKKASHVIKDAKGETVTEITDVFRPSNNISHNTGYVLTFDMNSPAIWDKYYSPTTGESSTGKIRKAAYEKKLSDAESDADKQVVLDNWREGPTFTPIGEGGVYGQDSIQVGDLITEDVYLSNKTVGTDTATVEPAYISFEEVSYEYQGLSKTINPREIAIPQSEYKELGALQSSFARAYTCIATVKLADETFLLYGELKTKADKDTLKKHYPTLADEIENALKPAYICSKAGYYGGQQFDAGTNYSALKTWCSLPNDRDKFKFNYDALDLLADPDYLKEKTTEQAYHSPYSDQMPVEYQAVFKATSEKNELKYEGVTLHDGDYISNDVFETKIRNDQRHYTRVSVKAGGEKIYLATSNFIYSGVPYGKGQIVDADVYNANTDATHSKVEAVDFTNTNQTSAIIKYYCYESYKPATGDSIKKGTVIDATGYSGLPNDQRYFVIQGKEPTETTTLYVSRESNINDLSKERVYTVVYQYTYYEDDDDGSVKMTNELHVINVHLQLESGVPQIGMLNPPSTVLPGNTVGLKAPDVIPGLYEVLTSGWELYTNSDDADHHRNGVPFTNNNTPLYWYQNQKNYVAFYSKTYLGKTYSNSVPLSVANYHDLDRVMADKGHHLYVDKANVDRPSKIYIDNRNCVSDPTKSELDLLKDFFDLSLITKTTEGITIAGDSITTEGHKLKGHALLDNHIRASRNLEFFLHSDISPKKYTTWVPIGNDNTTGNTGQCFDGTLHGDGYTISGLSHSLFGHLCGEVYNLGVTGTFTGAGIADEGSGYVENCWIKTTGTPTGTVKAVFGNPIDETADRKQVVNCYYPVTKAYAASSATPMPERAFYNGTVAYNLNGFYLNKRYYSGSTTWTGTPQKYQYLQPDANGALPDSMLTGYYPAANAVYPAYPSENAPLGYYVENRFANVDFRYAGGWIPTSNDIRQRTDSVNGREVTVYAPIWPDDYIFFGQKLTYDYNSAHDSLPTHIIKNNERLPVSDLSNRVYRAPAYFRDSLMDVAHFNLWAHLAMKSADQTRNAYPYMTAIDFAGHHDISYYKGFEPEAPHDSIGWFYPPLLDDDGLLGIVNHDETPNLLVYAPANSINKKTYDVLNEYFTDEPAYKNYYQGGDYRCVAQAPQASVLGHLVQSNLTAINDHLLVDKRDFNAPIGYRFNGSSRMWHQRIPDRYVDMSNGWETVSLPFTAELVTTNDKGEITHFYSGSHSVDEDGTKVGHEYWLREFTGKKSADADTYVATFNYPQATGKTKTVDNTFLWDHYYSHANQLDANRDTFQTYYDKSRTYDEYPLLQAAKPYIIGFPGKTYYEFDLSGEWTASNTASAPGQVFKQIITFASETGDTIGVSDDDKGITHDGYRFKPNYLEGKVKGYVLNTAGNSFDLSSTDTVAVPFRPYFVAATGQQAPTRGVVQHIKFDRDDSSFAIGDHDPSKEEMGESLTIRTQRHKIVVTSHLRTTTDVRIFSVSGLCVANFTIEPEQTIEWPLSNGGIYVVHAAGGRYVKKLAIR